MNRFDRVVDILDRAVGGASAPVGFHGPFWRGIGRNELVAKKVFGLQLISVGDGAGSTLVKALKGEIPFGADTGQPEATFNRMPSGLPQVSAEDIAFVQTWIDEGCPEDELVTPAPLAWRPTSALRARRHDDVWFHDPLNGWAVNSDGHIIRTTDGGESWKVQHSAPGVYLRCVGFANADVGWVGTLTPNRRLLRTTDGGATWSAVSPLPAEAPVAVCGLSVVDEQIVFASGTNRPADVPRMMKTLDGGATWTAWDMSAHASVLIDTFFVDALHGWVVGGKSSQPTPTTRDKLKPVVLETADGGATWTNRLAGQEDAFPFGEWGWKIQFLDDRIGFVSLENFSDAAILRTLDGGRTWTRRKVNDPQGNANLEGIGFLDENRGWVGGWGSADFMKGFSSATADGGESWQDANEIGLFINRFRFLGRPVAVGYASGDTIYKYSSEPAHRARAVARARRDPARAMLPDERMVGTPSGIAIRLEVPAGTKRLTLHVWNRFGEEVGCVLDEVNPASGARVFAWDGVDSRGRAVPPGDYLVRLTADDVAVSSFLSVQTPAAIEGARARGVARRRLPRATPRRPRPATVRALLAEPVHDLDWLRNALQVAIQLELSTLPPYLTARWTIEDDTDPVAASIYEIGREEMLHFGLACNLLAAIDGVPLLADDAIVPKYPGSLPGDVRPGLVVSLKKLSQEQAELFMKIEYPQDGPVARTGRDTIGEFYETMLAAFGNLKPVLSVDRQLDGPLNLFTVDSPAKVEAAIRLINLQGEGSNKSPEERPGDLAHFYRFGEIVHKKRFVKDAQGHWDYKGADLPMPAVHDMADVPAGGYRREDVPDIATWELIERFDRQYSGMLRLLQEAWTHGDPSILGRAIGQMNAMGRIGGKLVQKPRPDGRGNYGPCFRFVP